MENVIYRGIVVPANESPDGEYPTCIIVTQESNGFAIWRDSHNDGTELLRMDRYFTRDAAIEAAVAMVFSEREHYAMKKAA